MFIYEWGEATKVGGGWREDKEEEEDVDDDDNDGGDGEECE
jgi:hypothetical protein